MTGYLVSTDLDGTLLDHHTYSWLAAKPALEQLKTKQYPIVINTSKTAPEVNNLQLELELHDPFIVENGSAVFIHKNDNRFNTAGLQSNDTHFIKVLGCERNIITDFLFKFRQEHSVKFSTFSDFSLTDVMNSTGLEKESAKLAQNRKYSEPLIWQDSQENYAVFSQAIADANFKLLKGGRFIHILGQTNKGEAAKWLINQLKTKSAAKLIALGDSHNDLDMLKIADIAVLCKSPSSDFPKFEHENLIKTQDFGPIGWNTSMLNILNS